MKNVKRILSCALCFLMAASLMAGCGTQAAPEPVEPTVDTADLVLKNGSIQTMVSEEDVAQAVAVKDGVFVYVGDDAGVEAFIGEGTEVIDLAGQYVTPGFIDGHNHGQGYQLKCLFEMPLLEVEPTIEAYQEAMRDYIEKNPDVEVVHGSGMNLNAFPNAMSSAAFIDEVISDRPVLIHDISGHGIQLNTFAMEAIGLTKDTVASEGGTIYLDANGEPTGYLSDAGDMVAELDSSDYTVEQHKAAWEMFQDEMVTYGMTALQIPGGEINELDGWKMYDDMQKAGDLKLRVSMAVWGRDFSAEGGKEAVKKLDEAQKYVSDFQNITLCKTIIDGVPEGKTAYVLEPYAPEAEMPADYCGPQYCTQDALNDFVAAIDAAGYQVEIHAMGDAGVNASLNAYEYAQQQNGERDSRHQIAHVTLITDEDKVRMGKLGVIGAMQPMWFYYDPFFSPLEEMMFGTERFNTEYHIRDMVDAGIVITGSVDYPVTLDVAPLLGIEVGTTQCSPFTDQQGQEEYLRNADQVVTPYEALQWYTVNGAKAMFMEDKIGSIEVGKKADMVVLGYNILTCAPEDIAESPVNFTISDGRIVYKAEH